MFGLSSVRAKLSSGRRPVVRTHLKRARSRSGSTFRCMLPSSQAIHLPRPSHLDPHSSDHTTTTNNMPFPPLPPQVHSLLCGFCDSLDASRAWWSALRQSRSGTDESDSDIGTCAGQDGDIGEETISYFDNPASGLAVCRRSYHAPLARRVHVTHVGPRGTFIVVDGRNLSRVLHVNGPSLAPVENELLQITGNPQAPFDDDESLPSLESV